MAALRPEPITGARRRSPGTPFALLGRSAADFLKEKRTNTALGVVAGDPRQAAVHHMLDAVDGHRGFGDIGRDDYFPERVGSKGAVLLFWGQFPMERNESKALVRARGPESVDRGIDFPHPGHKNQHVA